jgi:hypothetical protein
MMELTTGLKNQATMPLPLKKQAEAVRFRAYWEEIGRLQAQRDWKEEQRDYLGGKP